MLVIFLPWSVVSPPDTSGADLVSAVVNEEEVSSEEDEDFIAKDEAEPDEEFHEVTDTLFTSLNSLSLTDHFLLQGDAEALDPEEVDTVDDNTGRGKRKRPEGGAQLLSISKEGIKKRKADSE